MKILRQKFAIMKLLTMSLAILNTPAIAGKLSIGDPIPAADIKMKNIDGKMVSINDIKGKKGTAVIFSCNSCPWSVAWEERITEIGNKFSQKGFGVIEINSNDPVRKPTDNFEGNVKRADKLGMKFSYTVDASSVVARTFGAEITPEVFLFDAENKLVYHGAVDDNGQDATAVNAHFLINALDEMNGGKAVTVSETKSMGCSIKYAAGS
jgi:peroxiredoxin